MNRKIGSALVVTLLAGLLPGCGPLLIGVGVEELLRDDPVTDPTNPALTVAAFAPGTGDPMVNGAPLTFRIEPQSDLTTEPVRVRVTPNKSGVRVTDARLVGTSGTHPVAAVAVPASQDVDVFVRSSDIPEDGTWEVRVTATDGAGRVAGATWTFLVDRTRPELSPLVTAIRARNSGEVEVDWLPTGEPGVAGYRVYCVVGGTTIPDDRSGLGVDHDDVIDVPGGAFASSILLTELPGTRTVYVQVVSYDAAGNESSLTPGSEASVRTRSGARGTFGTPVGNGGRVGDILDPDASASDAIRQLVVLDGGRALAATAGARLHIVPASSAAATQTSELGLSDARIDAGDLDGDRRDDVVAIAPGAKTIGAVAIQSGAGSFTVTPGQADVTMLPILDFALVDLDHDGAGGVVVLVDAGGGQLQKLAWFRDFDPATTSFTLDQSTLAPPFFANEGVHLRIADVDGDQHLDFIGAPDVNVAVRLGKATDPEASAAAFAYRNGLQEGFVGAGFSVHMLLPVDLNGDGLRDVLCGLQDGRVSVIEQRRGGGPAHVDLAAARTYVIGTGPVQVATGDFNADGIPDIAGLDEGSRVVRVLLSERSGSSPQYRPSQVIQAQSPASALAVLDRNGDGFLDLAIGTLDGTIEFWYGHGTRGVGNGGFFATGTPIPVRLKVGPAADFDRDGIPDFFAAAVDQSFTLQTLLGQGHQGQGTGEFVVGASSQTIYSTFRWGLAVGDVDGNGEIDLIGGADTSLEVHVRSGTGFVANGVANLHEDPANTFTNGFTRIPVAGDFDRDGFQDIVYGRPSGNVVVFFGKTGTGFFDDGRTLDLAFGSGGTTTRTDALSVLDVDGDARLDLASLDLSAGEIRFLLGNGAGGFRSSAEHPAVALPATLSGRDAGFAGSEPPTLRTADLDADGRPDLLAVDGSRVAPVFVAFSTGTGEYSAATLPPFPTANVTIREAHAADLDGDGRLDLIAAATTVTYTLRQTAERQFASAWVATAIPAQPAFSDTNVGVADVNGDTIPDLLVSGAEGSRIWIGTGATISYPADE